MARQDAHYYVAFGRRGQADDEFFETANDVARNLRAEIKRLPASIPPCGPPRARDRLRARKAHAADELSLSGKFTAWISPTKMVALARKKMADVPARSRPLLPAFRFPAPLRATPSISCTPTPFSSTSPTAKSFFRYFRETRRVLKPGGVTRFQINGFAGTPPRPAMPGPASASPRPKWPHFTLDNDFQLLELDGIAHTVHVDQLEEAARGLAREDS